MKNSNSTICKCLLLALITLSTTYTYAGLPKLISPRKWNGQNVTWSDFQVRHVPTDTLKPSFISVDIEKTEKTRRIGNIRFRYSDFTTYMYPTYSWYDPDRVTEWDLLSNNIWFDLAELNARLLQKEYNRDYDFESRQQAQRHAREEAVQRIKELNLETKNQTDTAALADYARNVRRELNMLPRTEPGVPNVNFRWYYGFDLGYWNVNPISESRNYLSTINGFDFSFIIGYKRFEGGFSIKAGMTDISQAGYFNDDEDVWMADKTVFTNSLLNLGYRVYSGQYFHLVPFMSIGKGIFIQDDPVYPKDSEKQHKAEGHWLNAGLCMDYVILRDLNYYQYSNEYLLRLKPYVSYAKIGGREIWSANVSLTFQFDILSQK